MRYDYDFRFDAPRDNMKFENRVENLSYNFACERVRKGNDFLGWLKDDSRVWIEHQTSDVTYFGYADSITKDLIHIVARYNEYTGTLEKRIA